MSVRRKCPKNSYSALSKFITGSRPRVRDGGVAHATLNTYMRSNAKRTAFIREVIAGTGFKSETQ